MFIRMCTIVTSSDMTSFVYIGDEKHHRKGKDMTPSKNKLCYLYWVIEESKDKLQKQCWKNQATVSKFKKLFYCGARLKTYKEVARKQSQVQEVITSFCGLGDWIDRSRQLISMTIVNLGVVCKLIFAFLPDNICVSIR